MERSIVWVLFFLIFLFIVPFVPDFVLGGVINSTYSFFNVTNVTRFNWTTSIIFIGSYNNTTTVGINNITTGLYPIYSQTSGESGQYSNTWEICFPRYLSGSNNISFVIQRGNGTYTNITSLLNESDVENFTLSIHKYCPPGRYSGYFTVSRVDNVSDKANVLTTVDVPLSINNTFDLTDNSAYFKGTMQVNDSYHSYYFNTSEIPENITGLSVKLSNLGEDIDLFLFDESGNLQAKSIKKGSSNEKIIDVDLPSSWEMWEFRVYGNESSNYRGDLYFSTLNTSVTSLNLGVFGPNNTGSGSYTLTNEDNRVLLNVNEYTEVYHVDVWNPDNISQDITNLFVPSFAEKIKVKIEWANETGKTITDWDLYLTDPSGTLIGSSTDKFLYSNVTGATREEYVIYSGPFNSNNEGFWNISVRNQTNSSIPLSYYTLTAYIWMDDTAWLSSNYTNGFNFNLSEVGNYTYVVGVNLTIPETEILDGKYEGYIKYNNTEGWNTRIPISFNVSAGTLVFNNTFNSATGTIKENIGFNRLGSSALTIDITYNNTGSQSIWYVNTTSNYTLTLDGDSNISFSVSNWPSNPIPPGTNEVMTITFNIDTTLTGNDEGIYSGWVLFNTTNTSLNSSSYPYKTFTLNLEVNLTDELVVQVESIKTKDGDDQIETPSQPENITFVTRVYLVNGTQLTDLNDNIGIKELYVENFTTARLTESHGGPQYTLTDVGQQRNPGIPGWLCNPSATPKCYVNATTPNTSMVGGWYRPSITVQWNTSQSLLTGTGSYNYLYVNNTGLKIDVITPVSKTIDLDEGTSHYTYFNISVINYGMWSPDGTITMDNCSYATIVAAAYNDTKCFAMMEASNRRFTFDRSSIDETIDPNGTEACEFVWKITAVANVTGDKTCSNKKIIISDHPNFGNITGITINVEDKDEPSTTTTTSSSDSAGTTSGTTTATTTTTTTTTILPYLDITSYPSTVSVEQGKSKTEDVKVKNTNESISQTVTLSLLYINSSWYNIPTSSKVIGREQTSTFTVNFTIPNDAEVDDYDGKFNASSSRIEVFKPFTLSVTPGPEMKSEINITLTDYQAQLSELETEIENMEARGYNTSEAADVWDSLRIKINNALTLIDSDDYKGAYDLFDDIEDLLNQTRTSIMEAPEIAGNWWAWGKWVIIGVVGTGAAFLGYLFWPTPEGYPTKKLYVQKQKVGGLKQKLDERYKRLKDSWKKIKKDTKKTSYFPKRDK